jgi:hypothetical protein
MPNVVVAGGVIQCSHSGQIKFSSGSSKLEVDGAGAITFGMEAGLSFAADAPGVIAPCTQPTQPPTTPPTLSPCTSSPATAGVSTIVTIGGAGVLLSNAKGLCVNTSDPSAKWSVASPGETVLSVTS